MFTGDAPGIPRGLVPDPRARTSGTTLQHADTDVCADGHGRQDHRPGAPQVALCDQRIRVKLIEELLRYMKTVNRSDEIIKEAHWQIEDL